MMTTSDYDDNNNVDGIRWLGRLVPFLLFHQDKTIEKLNYDL